MPYRTVLHCGMANPSALRNLAGEWTGRSTLFMSWMPPEQNSETCDSTMRVVDRGSYAEIEYLWSKDGPQHGEILVSGSEDSGRVEMGWVDTWHQSAAVMHLAGDGMTGERVTATGSYEAPGYGVWGWRIEFSADGDALEFRMTNITPDGQDDPAVHAVYTRTG